MPFNPNHSKSQGQKSDYTRKGDHMALQAGDYWIHKKEKGGRMEWSKPKGAWQGGFVF